MNTVNIGKHSITIYPIVRYIRYNDGQLGNTYISPIIGKIRFAKIVQDNSRTYTSVNWVVDRVSTGSNVEELAMLNERPGHFIALDKNGKVFNIVNLSGKS